MTDSQRVPMSALGRRLLRAANDDDARKLLAASGIGNRYSCQFDDLLGNVSNSSFLQTASNGTGSLFRVGFSYVNNSTKNVGVWEGQSGTTSSGRVMVYSGNDALAMQTETVLSIRGGFSNLNDGTDDAEYWFGFGRDMFNNANSPDDVNCCLFHYDQLTYGNHNYRAVSGNATSQERTDTGIAATANKFELFEVRFNSTATVVTFYINGALVATHSTHLPNFAFGFGAKMIKRSGTNSRSIMLDWVRLETYFGAER
jgi:hypothetical protein